MVEVNGSAQLAWCDIESLDSSRRQSAMAAVDAFDAAREKRQADRAEDDVAGTMYERLTPMLIKVAMLSAIGQPKMLKKRNLTVTLADVQSALIVVGRWERFAATFVENLSGSELERRAKSCLALVRKAGSIARWKVSRNTKSPKKMMDDIEATLKDRKQIKVSTGEGGVVWSWVA